MTNPKCPECGIEIDDHPAGRCLDRWIVEQVFGLDRMLARHNLGDGEIYYHWGYPIGHGIAPYYSSDIDAAWKVVEKMEQHENEILFSIVRKGSSMETLHWGATFRECLGYQEYWYADAPTAPLAITHASIKAVEEE